MGAFRAGRAAGAGGPDFGGPVHVDLAVPDIRWGIELDIHPEHRSDRGSRGDARRYRSLHFVEWQVEPVSEADMANLAMLWPTS